MITIEAVLDKDGILKKCTASGHAGGKRTENDIVCAAVSVLMRTAVHVLSGRKDITIRYKAPEPGFLSMEADYKAEGKAFLSAIGEFVIDGLASVAEEYPKYCKLIFLQNSRGLNSNLIK